MKNAGQIYVGIGGWNFPPWRGVFYPEGLAQAKELAYASSKLTAIEINATYYGSQKPESFRKWARETPDGFMFSVKGSRFCTNRRVLAEGAESVEALPEFRRDRAAASALAPCSGSSRRPRSSMRPTSAPSSSCSPRSRTGSRCATWWRCATTASWSPEFVALLREFNVAVVFSEHETFPAIADITGDFVYLRLQKGQDTIKTGYPPKDLDAWAKRLQTYATGAVPKDLPQVDPKNAPKAKPRDVFAYVIHEGKVRAPAAAMELIGRLK